MILISSIFQSLSLINQQKVCQFSVKKAAWFDVNPKIRTNFGDHITFPQSAFYITYSGLIL